MIFRGLASILGIFLGVYLIQLRPLARKLSILVLALASAITAWNMVLMNVGRWPFPTTYRIQLVLASFVIVNVLCIYYLARSRFEERCHQYRQWINEYKMTRKPAAGGRLSAIWPQEQAPLPKKVSELLRRGYTAPEIKARLLDEGTVSSESADRVDEEVETLVKAEKEVGRRNMWFGALFLTVAAIVIATKYFGALPDYTNFFTWVILLWGVIQFLMGFGQWRRGNFWRSKLTTSALDDQ